MYTRNKAADTSRDLCFQHMLSLSRGCFIPTLRHRPFIAAVTVTVITNGSTSSKIIHRSNISVGKNITVSTKKCRFYMSFLNDATSSIAATSTAVATYDTSIDALVARQKNRAIQYWETSKATSEEALKDQVHDDVMKHLKEGKVLPIFHALCRPPDQRLFPPKQRVNVGEDNSDQIQLSAATVTMGECNSEKENEKDKKNEISMKDEQSYIPAFFTVANKGYLKVRDHSSMQWSFSSRYTKIITDLVNAPEVTELSKPLNVDRKNGRNMITRRLSRGVVADCFDKSETESTYAITGNPGIGKSWTLIYALQQALLHENACVLFCFQKEGTAIVCIRRNDKIYGWSCKHSSFRANLDSYLFQNSNVLVLLVPRESTNGGATYSEGQRMLIMAVSNHKQHFYSSIKSTPDMVEDLFWGDLKMARPMTIIRMKPHDLAGQKILLKIPANCSHEEGVQIEDLKEKIFGASEDAPVIARLAKNERLIDFACSGGHIGNELRPKQRALWVFQVTISKDHDIPSSGLKELLISSGHCKRNGRFVRAENADSIEKIKWFWVVPQERESEWKDKKAKTKINKIAKEWLEKYVEQYVLVMYNDPNQVMSVRGRDDEHQGPQTNHTRTSNKAKRDQCTRIGISKAGTMQVLLLRLELVDNKEPHHVDAPAEEKFDVYTVQTLRLLCDALGLSTSGGKPAAIQRLLNCAKSESVKKFSSLLPTDVKINYDPVSRYRKGR